MKLRNGKEVSLEFVPSIVTLANLFMGFVALVMASNGMMDSAAWCIVWAWIWDMLDGNIARIFSVCSDLGRELDSLADMVSFIIAPAFVASRILPADFNLWALLPFFLFLAAGAYRLARFNMQLVHRSHFQGLPTPVAGLFLVMLIAASVKNGWVEWPWFNASLPVCFIVLASLMVSRTFYPKYSAMNPAKWLRSVLLGLVMLAFAALAFNLETALALLLLFYICFTPAFRVLPSDTTTHAGPPNEASHHKKTP